MISEALAILFNTIDQQADYIERMEYALNEILEWAVQEGLDANCLHDATDILQD